VACPPSLWNLNLWKNGFARILPCILNNEATHDNIFQNMIH
jgi:hypothetical protein